MKGASRASQSFCRSERATDAPGRGTTTGIPVEQETFVVLTVRGGLVTWIRPYNDREEALAELRSATEG